MNLKQNLLFDKYIELRIEVDLLSKELEDKHSKQMKCKNGCDLCCMDYSIFPVEYYSILNELKNQELDLKSSKQRDLQNNTCVFLKNHKCTIYNLRPIICRTHGLPLLFTNDEGGWELSACELNFTKFNFEKFTNENTFPQDKYNSKLFILNKKFISEFKEKKYDEFELIPLKNLV